MKKSAGIGAVGGTALAALTLVLAPALAATTQAEKKKAQVAPSLSIGSFTPAVADARLAAEFARRGIQPGSFRFTPSAATSTKSKAIKVAVRARAATPEEAVRDVAAPSGTAITAITPTAYNLGVSVGWKRFALSGDVAKVEGGGLPGSREMAEVGLSYTGKKFAGRVQLGADRADGAAPRLIAPDSSYSVDVGGSYSIARNLSVTGGVRYKIQRDRLEPLADERRDSQAVYVGTAFRF